MGISIGKKSFQFAKRTEVSSLIDYGEVADFYPDTMIIPKVLIMGLLNKPLDPAVSHFIISSFSRHA